MTTHAKYTQVVDLDLNAHYRVQTTGNVKARISMFSAREEETRTKRNIPTTPWIDFDLLSGGVSRAARIEFTVEGAGTVHVERLECVAFIRSPDQLCAEIAALDAAAKFIETTDEPGRAVSDLTDYEHNRRYLVGKLNKLEGR